MSEPHAATVDAYLRHLEDRWKRRTRRLGIFGLLAFALPLGLICSQLVNAHAWLHLALVGVLIAGHTASIEYWRRR